MTGGQRFGLRQLGIWRHGAADVCIYQVENRRRWPTYADSNRVRPRQLSSPSTGSRPTAREYRYFLLHRSRENDRPVSGWPTPTPRSSDGFSDTLLRLAQAYASYTPRFMPRGDMSTPVAAGRRRCLLGGRRHFPGRHFLLRRCLGEEGVKYLLGDAIGVQVQPATLVDRRAVLDEGVRHADSVDDDIPPTRPRPGLRVLLSRTLRQARFLPP